MVKERISTAPKGSPTAHLGYRPSHAADRCGAVHFEVDNFDVGCLPRDESTY
jgi:hypothetical protein